MANLTDFLAGFPEFATADPGLVQAKLNAAILEVDVNATAPLTDQIIFYMCARKLAKMPTGNSAKLINKDGSTVYDDELARLQSLVVGPCVAP